MMYAGLIGISTFYALMMGAGLRLEGSRSILPHPASSCLIPASSQPHVVSVQHADVTLPEPLHVLVN